MVKYYIDLMVRPTSHPAAVDGVGGFMESCIDITDQLTVLVNGFYIINLLNLVDEVD
jgi:hypothetical protein